MAILFLRVFHTFYLKFFTWTVDVIQCRIIFCFQTCLNKRVADELFCRRNVGQAHWIYAWKFDILHSFDIICNTDVQTWPTSIILFRIYCICDRLRSMSTPQIGVHWRHYLKSRSDLRLFSNQRPFQILRSMANSLLSNRRE
jgi:hypothetical protein